MRAIHKLAVAIVPISLLALLLIVSAPVINADEAVTIPDSNLEAAIRTVIHKPSGDISGSDLETLTVLHAENRGITDITGLQYCTGLRELWLQDNQISDIKALSDLTGLATLHLERNPVTDISPLSNLANLTELGFSGKQLNDTSPLSSLTGLTKLDLDQIQLSDSSIISNLTSLNHLSILQSPVSNISSLSNLNSLTYLNLGYTQISDVSPLSNLTSLNYLAIQYNQVSDISPLSGLTKLTELRLNFNQISDISPLSNLTNLTYLGLDQNRISDITPLSFLTNLTYLNLGWNRISDISPLSSLIRLSLLTLMSNQISDISPLSSLTSISSASLYNNKISDIFPLVKNSGINEGDALSLYGNPLSIASKNQYIPELEGRGVTVSPRSSVPRENGFWAPLPSAVSTDRKVVGTNALFALIFVLVLYFGATLFNSTFKENYETIQHWLSRASGRLRFIGHSIRKRRDKIVRARLNAPRYLEGLVSVAICALIYSFLDPYFTHGLRELELFISLAISIGIATYSYEGIQILLSTSRFHIPAAIKIFPLAVAIAVVFVIISRAIDFHPGLIYGFVGAYTTLSISRSLDKRQQAIAILLSTLVLLIVTISAFFIRQPIANVPGGGENFWILLVDGILVGVFVIGLEGIVFSVVPLTFMDGAKLKAWNFWVWLVVAFVVTYVFWWIIINKDRALMQAVRNTNVIIMFVLMGFFLFVSVGTWLYFRWRRQPLPKETLEKQTSVSLEEVGEHNNPVLMTEADKHTSDSPEEIQKQGN